LVYSYYTIYDCYFIFKRKSYLNTQNFCPVKLITTDTRVAEINGRYITSYSKKKSWVLELQKRDTMYTKTNLIGSIKFFLFELNVKFLFMKKLLTEPHTNEITLDIDAETPKMY
jgi:hypothetical protein